MMSLAGVSLLVVLVATVVRDAQCVRGGTEVAAGEFPWMGSLRTPDRVHICGLVIGHRNWILTSGHCVEGTGLTMEFGHVYRGAGYVYAYDTVTRHPNYDQGNGYYPNDLALLHVSGDGIATEHVFMEAVQGFDTGTPRMGQTCITAGWGQTSYGSALPQAMQKATIPVINDVECANQWQAYFSPASHICAWDQASETAGLCTYDEGGAMVCNNAGVWELVGLGSFYGHRCETGYPSVYVRISQYGDWVCEATGNQLCW